MLLLWHTIPRKRHVPSQTQRRGSRHIPDIPPPKRNAIPAFRNTSQPKRSGSNPSSQHFDSRDSEGIHNYQQTDDGKPMINLRGLTLCNYCVVPSHPQATCKTKIRNVENGVVRDTHPARGTIPSKIK